jgi:signal peptidase I
MFLRTFVVEAFRIPSGSMKNTLLVGDVLFVNKLIYGVEIPFIHKRLPEVREPRRGDILVFDSIEEEMQNMKIVKRLIGIPGDTLEMRAGVVFLDGRQLDEPYAINSNPREGTDPLARARMRDWQVKHFAGPIPSNYFPDVHHWGPIVVPHDSLFVMGDNRDDSNDGRFWGFLPRDSVYGRPMLVYFSYNGESWDRFAFLTQIRWKRLFTVPR